MGCTKKRNLFRLSTAFFHASAQGNTLSEGFILYEAVFDKKLGSFMTVEKLNARGIWDYKLKFDNFLRIVYTKEKPQKTYVREFSFSIRIQTGGYDRKMTQGDVRLENKADANNQISYPFNWAQTVMVTDEGILKNPEYLKQ